MALNIRPLPECGLVIVLSESTLVELQGAVTAVLLLSKQLHRRDYHHRHQVTSEAREYHRSKQMSPHFIGGAKSPPPTSPGCTARLHVCEIKHMPSACTPFVEMAAL
jgi:hypothetical protein